MPVLYGYVAIRKITASLEFALVSRKDARRPGRRFLVRGLDRDGNAANFVETEQLLVVQSQGTDRAARSQLTVCSHVQIRGSIPLIWTMKPNMKWAPPVRISSNFDESF